jgi:hypothetical protein
MTHHDSSWLMAHHGVVGGGATAAAGQQWEVEYISGINTSMIVLGFRV